MNASIHRLIKAVNRFLEPFGARLVSSDADKFNMNSAVRRIQNHGLCIDNVIDIGGSDGSWSRQALHYFPKASFLIIEPLKEREAALRTLARQHSNIAYESCVAGDIDDGMAMLNIADDLDGSTVNGRGGMYRKVPVRTIDTIVSERGLTGSFLLKLDTHGYEVPILQGATKTLKRTSIVIMEVYNFQITDNSLRFHEMCAHMENLGFRCFDVAGLMLREYDQSLWQMDLCFCKSNAPIFKYSNYR